MYNIEIEQLDGHHTLTLGPVMVFWQICCGSAIILTPPYSLFSRMLQHTWKHSSVVGYTCNINSSVFILKSHDTSEVLHCTRLNPANITRTYNSTSTVATRSTLYKHKRQMGQRASFVLKPQHRFPEEPRTKRSTHPN